MGDIRCLKSVEIDLFEVNGCINHWFRSESELQNEGKGGFLRGKIRIKGIDKNVETVRRIELSLLSSHATKLHCNLLRISPKNKEFHRKAHQTTKSVTDSVMSPSAYSVVLVRDSNETFKIDRTNHGYLPSGFKVGEMWDEENQTLTLGEKESENNPFVNGSPVDKEYGLCLTIVKPLSKQEQKSESSKYFIFVVVLTFHSVITKPGVYGSVK